MELREVHGEMADAVKAFLANREELRDANNWSGLFNYSWKPEGLPYGYAIFDEGKMVGFLGTIFSERFIEGRPQLCCNTTCWFVEPEFRTQMQALRLFMPILKMKGLLITNLSPSVSAARICKQFGYKSLDEEQVAVPVLPNLSFGSAKPVLTSFDPGEIEGHLNPEEKRILRDHLGMACKHFLLKERDTGQHCYGIATTSPMSKLRLLKGQWLNLCYLSNVGVFTRHYSRIRTRLLREGRFFLLRYDARLVPERLSRLEVRSQKTRQYKYPARFAGIIDNLYSELITFNKY